MGETDPNIPVSSRRRALLVWLGVACLIVLEFVLFRHFLIREVIWAYPPNNDQVAYLQQTYELYEKSRALGLWNAIIHQSPAPQGALMQTQVAILFRLIGASRFNALLLNFFYFALFQIILVWTARWLSGRWSVALVSLGLLLAARTPFCGAGGIYDFRMDFIAFCLYGIFICLVMRSGVFTHRGWSVVAGIGAAVLIGVRFVAAAYLGGVFAIILFVALGAWMFQARSFGHFPARQFRGGLICCAVMALIVGPILWARRQAIHDYYVVGHVTGAERDIRAASMGTTELWKAIQFYPNKLLWLHAGLVFLLVFATIIALASVMWWTARRGNRKALASNFKFPLGMAYLFAVACLLAPMAILTMDVAKSPVVANVMVAPLVWLAVLSLVRFPRGSVVPGFEGILALFAVAVLSLGIRNQVKAYDADRFMSRHRQDVEKIESMDDLIAERSRAGHLQSITIFNNRISDYLNAEVCRLMTYERHGYFVNVGDQFSSLLEVPQSEIFKQLGECEFAMISRCDRHAAGYDYPFNHEMEQLEPKVQAICQQTMDKIGVYRIFDYEVIVFARRHISRQ